MRLVEVVMLVGAHCVSPVEHSQMMTDATKVQCAVVIEKDTEQGTLKVTPEAAARDPQVAAAMDRFRAAPVDPMNAASTRIVPAWAPAGSPATEVKAPAANPVPPPQQPSATAAEPIPDEAAQNTAEPAPEAAPPAAAAAPKPPKKMVVLAPRKAAPSKPAAKKKQQAAAESAPASKRAQCKGAAVAKWYKTGDGRKKFRCVKPASDSAPDQLY